MKPSSHPPSSRGLSYRESGVDIEAGNRLVERIKPAARSTLRPEVLTGLGGFGALFELPQGRYRQPVLVSGTDGVGTKLKLAQQLARHETIGIDLVAMCANDILVAGAEPLFFLDYFATGRLDVDLAATVIEGIAQGCRQAGPPSSAGRAPRCRACMRGRTTIWPDSVSVSWKRRRYWTGPRSGAVTGWWASPPPDPIRMAIPSFAGSSRSGTPTPISPSATPPWVMP